jgi:hypothetical protein
MKTKILGYVAISALALISLEFVRADSIDDFVNKYYPPLKQNENDGTGQLGILTNFFKEVPPASQAEVLARILEKASITTPPDNDLIESILSVSKGFQDNKVEWNAHLEKLIYAQAKNPDPNVRALAVYALAKIRQDTAHDFVLTFLNDPDERVRHVTLSSIDTWPDAEAIYQKFIQDHQSDTSYSKSIQDANVLVKLIHEKAK